MLLIDKSKKTTPTGATKKITATRPTTMHSTTWCFFIDPDGMMSLATIGLIIGSVLDDNVAKPNKLIQGAGHLCRFVNGNRKIKWIY